MKAVFLKELTQFFKTPVGYVYMAVTLFILGLLFTLQSLFTFSADLPAFLGSAQLVFFFTSPLLTMRLFTEERRSKTEQLLYTAPVRMADIVMGKALAAFVPFAVSLAVILSCFLVVGIFGFPDWPRTWGAFIGYVLLGSVFICLGTYVSAVTESQITAAIMTFALIFGFWILPALTALLPNSRLSGLLFVLLLALAAAGWLIRTTLVIKAGIIFFISCLAVIFIVLGVHDQAFDGFLPRFLNAVSLSSRYDNFLRGIIRPGDLVYYISFGGFFLYLTVWQLEKRRWSGE
jgi:ABC-2 type transport system permease protein